MQQDASAARITLRVSAARSASSGVRQDAGSTAPVVRRPGFRQVGYPDYYFRVELAWAKLLGVVLLLAPVPARLTEWAYAGFAFTLASALIAHVAAGDGPDAWGWAAGTGVLWALSYALWRRLQARHVERLTTR
jgi:hypothetical protein